MRLVIIEDHSVMRGVLADSLQHLACEVRFCASGEEALSVCQEFAADCVTVDFRLNGIDGIATIRRLRAMRPTALLIMVTQCDEPALREQARDAGADGFVLKDQLSDLVALLNIYSQSFRASAQARD